LPFDSEAEVCLKGAGARKGDFRRLAVIARKRQRLQKRQAQKETQRQFDQNLPRIPQNAFRKIHKITFAKFSEIWLKTHAETSLKRSTLARYRDIIGRVFMPALGAIPLCNLKAFHIHALAAERLKAVSPKTAADELGLMKQMLGCARRWGYIDSDPSEPIKRPRSGNAEIEILNPEEIGKLIAAIDRRYRLALLTCVLTGMRAGELWALQWPDIDFETLQIHVKRSLWRGEFQSPKSRSSVRRIAIPQRLALELKKWKLASSPNELDLVFPNGEGKPACHDNFVKRHFEPALRRAGLKKVRFHSLRHSNASWRIAAGQNLKFVQNQLGHSSIKITLDVYAHLIDDFSYGQRQVRLLEASLDSVKSPQEERLLPVAGASSP
jgi:integrase